MQNDFITGTLGTREAESIVKSVSDKIERWRGRVLFTRDTHFEDYLATLEGRALPVPHCIKGSEGWQLDPALADFADEAPIEKNTFGSCRLAELLCAQNEKEPIGQITLVGLCTDTGVISNALVIKAFLPETTITVDAACCAGSTPEGHRRALDAMKVCQINIINE